MDTLPGNLPEELQPDPLSEVECECLRKDCTLLRSATESADLGVFEYFPGIDHLEANDSWYRLTGIPRGQSLRSFSGRVSPRDRRKLTLLLCRKKETETCSLTITYLHPEKGERGLCITGQVTAIGGSPENPLRFVGVLSDKTEHLRMKYDLENFTIALEQAAIEAYELKKKAEVADEAKNQFLATVTHEIRTPLNGILGMTTLLLDSELTAEQRDFARILKSSGDSLLGLVNQILDFSKMQEQGLVLNSGTFDPHLAIQEELLPYITQAHRKGLEFFLQIEPDVPHRVLGDEDRLRQICSILVQNAVKFTEKGSIRARLEKIEDSGQHIVVRFSVTDTGIGIYPDTHKTLFKPFAQGDGSTTRKYGGTGLGLAIAQKLTELMGGHIDVASEVDRGTTFSFTARLEKPVPGS